MKGLIKKDLLTIKGNLKFLLLFIFVFTSLALQGKQDMSFLPAFICVMIFMSTFSYDEYNNWNSYAITLPSGRKNIVKAKYIASIILLICTIIFTTVLTLIIGYVNNDISFDKIIINIVSSFIGAGLIILFMYPLIFKFGIEKGRIYLFIVVFVMVALFGFILKDLNLNSFNSAVKILNKYWRIIIPIITSLCLFISYTISKRIVMKKEY